MSSCIAFTACILLVLVLANYWPASHIYAMCPAHVTFSTSKKLQIPWTDTLKDVESAELEELTVECRSAWHSLETELTARKNPQKDSYLDNCHAILQEKVGIINQLGLVSQDEDFLTKAKTALEALKSGRIKNGRDSGKYEQFLWLISRVAGPASVLLLICSGVSRRTVERLDSSQSAILVKRIVRCCDSLSNNILNEKAKAVGLCETNISLPRATFLTQRASGKRKRGKSDNTASSIAWTDPVSVSKPTYMALSAAQNDSTSSTTSAYYSPVFSGSPDASISQPSSNCSNLQTINSSADWQNTVAEPKDEVSRTGSQNPQVNKASNSLLLLLYSLGCFRIQKRVLFLGLSPQKRWNDNGHVHEVTLLDAGLIEQYARLFSTEIELEQAIKSCIQNSMIIPNTLEDGTMAYSLTDESQIQIPSSSDQTELSLQGLIFITHIYPREENLHDS